MPGIRAAAYHRSVPEEASDSVIKQRRRFERHAIEAECRLSRADGLGGTLSGSSRNLSRNGVLVRVPGGDCLGLVAPNVDCHLEVQLPSAGSRRGPVLRASGVVVRAERYDDERITVALALVRMDLVRRLEAKPQDSVTGSC